MKVFPHEYKRALGERQAAAKAEATIERAKADKAGDKKAKSPAAK